MRRVLCGIPVLVIVFVIWHVKLMNILDTKNCSLEKRLIGKLLLKCEDEMLNTTETSLIEKE